MAPYLIVNVLTDIAYWILGMCGVAALLMVIVLTYTLIRR